MNESWTQLVAAVLPRMRERMPEWAVLKNHESLPCVTGDVDLCVDHSQWNAFTYHLLDILSEFGDYAAVFCDHFVGVRLIFMVRRNDSLSASVLEVDLADGIWWKGHRVLDARDVITLARDDPRGFRCATPGTEAAFHLTVETLGRLGSLKQTARHFRRTRELAGRDAKGFAASMTLMHGVIGADAARRFLEGSWNSFEGLLLIVRRMGRGPLGLYRRAIYWTSRRRHLHWRSLPRRVPHGIDEWLSRVGRGHPVSEIRMGETR